MGLENTNVRVALLYTGLIGLSSGIWGYAVLSGYLLGLTGTNTSVGLAEGVQGAVQAALAIPSGMFADKASRESVLKCASAVGVFAVIALNLALTVGQQSGNEFVMVTAGLALFGAFSGMCNAAIGAIFADSLSGTERPRFMTYRYAIAVLSSAAGPLAGIVVFNMTKNDWSIEELRKVMHTGTICAAAPILLLVFLKDNLTLGAESEAHGVGARGTTTTTSAAAVGDDVDVNVVEHTTEDGDIIQREVVATSEAFDDESSTLLYSGNGSMPMSPLSTCESPVLVFNRTRARETVDAVAGGATGLFGLKPHHIPYLCTSADIVFGLASGMTIKFFPLFFKDEVSLSPVQVNMIFCATPFIMSIAVLIGERVSVRLGRVQTVLSSKFIGIGLLYLMWWMGVGYEHSDGHTKPPMWANVMIIVPVFMSRTVLMNATTPLQKSILMDFVPKSSRGIWSAFDSLTAFGWSGSALLGGYIADQYGYGATFLVTAGMQTLGWLIIALMLPLVPKDLSVMPVASGSTSAVKPVVTVSTDDMSTVDSMREPLLANGEEGEVAV
jgi:MFS family permease